MIVGGGLGGLVAAITRLRAASRLTVAGPLAPRPSAHSVDHEPFRAGTRCGKRTCADTGIRGHSAPSLPWYLPLRSATTQPEEVGP